MTDLVSDAALAADVVREAGLLARELRTTGLAVDTKTSVSDVVTAAVSVRDVKDDRFTLDFALFSDAHRMIAATGEAVVVAFDYAAKKKAPLPAAVRARLV